MASVSLSTLPTHLLSSILCRVTEDLGYKGLGSLIRSGHEGRGLVYTKDVLRELPMDDFLGNPKLANKRTKTRFFFNKCMEAGNPDACYIEGVRRIFQDREVGPGLSLISQVQKESMNAKFALGILFQCVGRSTRGSVMIREVEKEAEDYFEMTFLAVELVDLIQEIRTANVFCPHRYLRLARADPIPACL